MDKEAVQANAKNTSSDKLAVSTKPIVHEAAAASNHALPNILTSGKSSNSVQVGLVRT